MKDIMVYMQPLHLSINKTIILSEGLPIAIYCLSSQLQFLRDAQIEAICYFFAYIQHS